MKYHTFTVLDIRFITTLIYYLAYGLMDCIPRVVINLDIQLCSMQR